MRFRPAIPILLVSVVCLPGMRPAAAAAPVFINDPFQLGVASDLLRAHVHRCPDRHSSPRQPIGARGTQRAGTRTGTPSCLIFLRERNTISLGHRLFLILP